MAIDDLLKGMSMFSEGVSEYQQGQAINDARQKLGAMQTAQSLQGQALADHMRQQQEVGQDLALRLTAAGAAPEKVMSATAGLVPSASMMQQGLLTQQAETAKMAATGPSSPAGVEAAKAASAYNVEKMKMEYLTGGKTQKAYDELTNKFEKRQDIVPILKNANQLDDAITQLTSTKGADGSAIFANLARIGLVKNANGGRPSQQEFAAVEDSPAFFDKARKAVGLQATGTYPQDKTQFWIDVLTRNKQNNIISLNNAIDAEAHSASIRNPILEEGRTAQILKSKYANILGPVSPGSAAAQPPGDQQIATKRSQQLRTWAALPGNAGTTKAQQALTEAAKAEAMGQ